MDVSVVVSLVANLIVRMLRVFLTLASLFFGYTPDTGAGVVSAATLLPAFENCQSPVSLLKIIATAGGGALLTLVGMLTITLGLVSLLNIFFRGTFDSVMLIFAPFIDRFGGMYGRGGMMGGMRGMGGSGRGRLGGMRGGFGRGMMGRYGMPILPQTVSGSVGLLIAGAVLTTMGNASDLVDMAFSALSLIVMGAITALVQLIYQVVAMAGSAAGASLIALCGG